MTGRSSIAAVLLAIALALVPAIDSSPDLSNDVTYDSDACFANQLSRAFEPLPAPLEAAREPDILDHFISVDFRVMEYVDRFEGEAKLYLGKDFRIYRLKVRFVDKFDGSLSPRTVGECSTKGFDVPSVTILRSYWDEATDLTREQLVMHELGHCVLFEGHDKRKFMGENPTSIMYPEILDDGLYSRLRAYYMLELFQQQHVGRGYMGKDIGPCKR